MKISTVILVLSIAFAFTLPVSAQPGQCEAVGGVLSTNIGAITEGGMNLGPVFGDLAGAVAAKIVSANSDGTFTLQHYWVTSQGDTILMKPAVLTPTYPVSQSIVLDKSVVAVPWGNYASEITGGTGKFDGATGRVSYFGMADFSKGTLVLRYAGTVCFQRQK